MSRVLCSLANFRRRISQKQSAAMITYAAAGLLIYTFMYVSCTNVRLFKGRTVLLSI